MPDHDELFKELIKEFFFELLEFILPNQIFTSLDKSFRIELDKELPSDIGPGKSHRADSVSKVKKINAEPYLIHIEVESSHNSEFPERMFYYYSSLRKKYKLEIFPIAILTFKAPYKEQPSSLTCKIGNLKIVEFNFKCLQLNRLLWQEYSTTSNPVICALIPLMRYPENERVEVKVASLVRLSQIADQLGNKLPPTKIKIIQKFIDAYTPLLPSEEIQFDTRLKQLKPNLREAIMTYITSWERKGIELGLTKGREEGRMQKSLELTIRLLTKRFGESLNSNLINQVNSLSATSIDKLAEDFLDFRSLEDFQDWLSRAAQKAE